MEFENVIKENYFLTLNKINVNEKTETKNGLTYLSWAWAWGEVKKRHPNANYKVYEKPDGRIYWDDGKTAWVKVSVTIKEIEHIEYLPIMNFKNQSMPINSITSFDVNKAIQRGLTKACARHGLGLYIYAGEDLPEGETETRTKLNAPTDEQITRLESLGGNLQIVATYFKKDKNEVTAADVDCLIEAKEKQLKKQQEARNEKQQ